MGLIYQNTADWLTKNITYGLFLSDRSVLNDVETEITVVTGIMMQNLPRESAWHLRGLRRIGVAKEDAEKVWKCVCWTLFLFFPFKLLWGLWGGRRGVEPRANWGNIG